MIDTGNLKGIPSTYGVYLFKNGKKILYIGKSVNLSARLRSHLQNAKLDNKEAAIVQLGDKIEYYQTESEFSALLLESKLIKKYKPKYNLRWKDDKSYLYIKITVSDDYPKIYLSRKPEKDRSQYFGPFSSVRSGEDILRSIRKIFPFCSQKKRTKKACFYSKLNLCNPCPNAIDSINDKVKKRELKKIYRSNIRKILTVLEGKKNKVIDELNDKLKTLTKERDYEQALIIRNKIFGFRHLVMEKKFVNFEGEDTINKSQIMLTDLQKILSPYFTIINNLHRIECYDISNINQKQATGSMVVLTDGQMDKSQYKRFKIKNMKLRSDIEMLGEVLHRRLKNNWLLPQLIIIDGGLPQVRYTLLQLADLKLTIPVIGIAKKPDRLVVGVNNLPTVRLPLNSPGFNLIRLIRDESHRFAKKYHLLLRSKKIFRPSLV